MGVDEAPRFDRVARIYAPIERITFGGALARCRNRFISELADRRSALILGDGDGRFTAQLLTHYPSIEVTAVDASGAMLELLRKNVERRAPEALLRTVRADARALELLPSRYDLVATHFFLDCFTTNEVDALLERVLPALRERALWVVSDFAVPTGIFRFPAWLLVRILYLVFRILTGLRITALPSHSQTFEKHGLTLVASRSSLFGLLTSELWERRSASESQIVLASAPL